MDARQAGRPAWRRADAGLGAPASCPETSPRAWSVQPEAPERAPRRGAGGPLSALLPRPMAGSSEPKGDKKGEKMDLYEKMGYKSTEKKKSGIPESSSFSKPQISRPRRM